VSSVCGWGQDESFDREIVDMFVGVGGGLDGVEGGEDN